MKKYNKHFFLLLLMSFILTFFSCSSPTDPNGDNDIVELAWSYSIEKNASMVTRLQPAIKNNRVYYAGDTSLVCRELDSGELIWETDINYNLFFPGGKIIFDDNRLYSKDSRSYRSYNAENGELIWSTEYLGPYSRSSETYFATGDDHLFFSGSQKIGRIDKKNGNIDYPIEIYYDSIAEDIFYHIKDITLSPEGNLYIPSYISSRDSTSYQFNVTEGSIFCFNKNGENIWEYNVPVKKVWSSFLEDSITVSGDPSECVIWGDLLMSASGDRVFALNRFTGEIEWENAQGFNFSEISNLSSVDSKLFITDIAGNIYFFSLDNGDYIGITRTREISPVIIHVTLDDKWIYLVNPFLSGLSIIDQETGSILWKENAAVLGGYNSPVAVGEGYMVNVGNENVFCYKLK